MKAITRIHVEGFRSLKEVDLAPGRVTVLIGANGSGKSNLLSVLRLAPLLRTESLRTFVGEGGGASALLHYGPKVTREISLRLEFDQETGSNAYEARLGYAAGDSVIFLDETVQFRPPGNADFHPPISLGAGHAESRVREEAEDIQGRPGAAGRAKTVKTIHWWPSRMNFFHFHDTSSESPLRRNSRQEDTDYLRSDGSNLAAYLRTLAESEGESYRAAWTRIGGLMRRVAPFIKTLQPSPVDPSRPESSAVRLDWIDERDQAFGPHHLSDGTLRAIALFTALAQPTENLPALISIDEPELGLHPAALEVLASLVRSVTPHCQVLLATQSPALLDYFDAADVVVAERDSGATRLNRLEPEELSAWLEDYSLAELYDKNVLGGRP